MQRRLYALLLLLLLVPFASMAESFSVESLPLSDGQQHLRGYDPESKSYVYVSLGRYPYTEDGEIRPCLWRILGIEEGYAYFLNEYVVDADIFHPVKKDQPRDWRDYQMYNTMNDTMVYKMFNNKEIAALRYTDDLGRLFIMSNEESMQAAYGFRKILTKPQWERSCLPTPWAIKNGAFVDPGNQCTTYWSRSCRHTAAGGYEWIFGYNGHISMAGFTRICGIRPACYVDISMLDGISGEGTMDDPYIFASVQ